MAQKTFQVDTYQVLTAVESNGFGGQKWRGCIYCYGSGYRFWIYFIAPGRPAGSPGTNYSRNYGWMSVPIDEMPFYLDLLRNEKPVYGLLNESATYNGIFTGHEPVGEEEKEALGWSA